MKSLSQGVGDCGRVGFWVIREDTSNVAEYEWSTCTSANRSHESRTRG